ncbi:Uncharacterized protein Adt_03723 [Abeliophyllum distichum]|uniref:Retrotransposon Copia-like N-terminal domain-containing protein n=1 Tax=Abeliophyllum distichum TaxID=126358 RepID=A0ABD1VZA6_9LAMI
MVNINPSNQSHSSDSNCTIQVPALVNNLALFGMNLTQATSVKLDSDNFLLWKNVIMHVVRGHGLEVYLVDTKNADNLEIAGKKVDHLDLVTQVLAGLDEEYTPIVVQVNSRD